jgi:hypothetical protein
MSLFIEVLRRNYRAGKIEKAKLESLISDGKITQEEFDHIIGA